MNLKKIYDDAAQMAREYALDAKEVAENTAKDVSTALTSVGTVAAKDVATVYVIAKMLLQPPKK